ncbi:MAG TPA: insulinase family protein [Candidatus Elarobacter sp.]
MTLPRRLSRAAISVAALLVWGGAASAQTAPFGTLPGGIAYTIETDPSQPAAAVSLWYRAPASGFDAVPLPGLAKVAATTVAASTPVTGMSLGQVVRRAGGRLSIAAYPDSVAITALVAPEQVAAVVRAMTADYFAPVTDGAGLRIAQREVADDMLYRSFVPADAIEDALAAALFTAGPFHDGQGATVEQIRAVTLPRVTAFAERAFRPSNAVLVLTGNVPSTALTAVAARNGASPGTEPPVPPAPRPQPTTIAKTANVGGIGLGWNGPPIADEASATALDLVADRLFSASGSVTKALAKRKATVTGRFVTFHDPGMFLVTISGDEAAAVRPAVEAAIAEAAHPLAPAPFGAAKAAFVYHLLDDMQTPDQLADTFGWYAVEGNPSYAPARGGARSRYFSLAAALTPEAVAAIAHRYLGTAPAVVTLATPAPAKPS